MPTLSTTYRFFVFIACAVPLTLHAMEDYDK